MFDPGIASEDPSSAYFPVLGPNINTAAKAAAAPHK